MSKKKSKFTSQTVSLGFDGTALYEAEPGAKAAVVLTINVSAMPDNYSFVRLAEALKHFTTQTQWPPVADTE